MVSCLALAVATFHQFAAFLLTVAGVIEGSVYSMRPVPPFAVPVIFDLMFWGGVWSVIYAAVAAGLSWRWPLVLQGFIFGFVGPVLVGWFVVAPLKGQAIMAGGDVKRMILSILINGAFGVGVALIYPILRDAVRAGRMSRTTGR